MKSIKGLLIKDILQLRSYLKSLVIFIMIFVLCSLSYNESTELIYVLPMMLALGFGMFAIASFSYDSLAKSDKFFLSMPFTRKELVIEKYVLSIGLTFLGAVFGVIVGIIMSKVRNVQIAGISDILISMASSLLTIGLFQSIQIPNIYKHGIEKGKINSFITVALFIVIGIGLMILGNYSNIDLSFVNNIGYIAIFAILLACALIVYFISYNISLKIMNKKDF